MKAEVVSSFGNMLKIMYEVLFNVWDQDNDPTPYYYPSIKSHQDHELLNE